MTSMLSEFDTANIFVGLSGIQISEVIDLGEGVVLKPVYAHLFAPFMLAFNRPASHNKHHPGPWKAAKGGFSFDISGELFIPGIVGKQFRSSTAVMNTILALLRIWANPAVIAPVLSDTAFEEAASKTEIEPVFYPMEVTPRWFSLSSSTQTADTNVLDWVRQHWKAVHRMTQGSSEFAFALDALSKGQLIQNPALSLVSLWAALEALFSPATAELKFRVSSLIACFLEAPGTRRSERQKAVAKLYDKRSSAAHGQPKHGNEDLLKTFILLRDVLIEIVNRGSVPTKEELNDLLFGTDLKVEVI